MRDEDAINAEPVFTPREPWRTSLSVGHWYRASTDFALEHLKEPKGNLLVIGSPIAEARDLEKLGWDMTYLDIRQPPGEFRDFIQACATKIPLDDQIFDAVSSACVMTHVGLGRYRDPVVENGDEKMICEVSRVLKRGGPAVITFGPVASREKPVKFGNVHRIYTIPEVHRLAALAGMKVEVLKIWDAVKMRWVEKPHSGVQPNSYVSTVLRHVAAA